MIRATPEQREPTGFCILPSLPAVYYHNSTGTSWDAPVFYHSPKDITGELHSI